jgi:transposase
VRTIDAYVDSLDLLSLGLRDVSSDGGAGQPPYDPADPLKLYIYGYLNQLRSSRRLEREARRNTEVIWLLGDLAPAIGPSAISARTTLPGCALNREFGLSARELKLLGGDLVAIDDAFSHGDASKASILTEKRLERCRPNVDDQAEDVAAAATSSAGARRWHRSWRPCASGGRRRQPIWPSCNTAATVSCRAPIRMRGCSRSTGRSWPATACRSRSTTSTS